MVTEPSLYPGRWSGDDPKPDPKPNRSDEIIDRWFADHFHGAPHMGRMTNAYEYLRSTLGELKQRLRDSSQT
jgi:hypothetical protein